MQIIRVSALLICVSIIAACSSTINTYQQTLKQAFAPGNGVELSKAELSQRTVDVLYARAGDRPRALLVLAYYEHDQQYWISGDEALLQMSKGRVVKTTGFKNDLLFTANYGSDPLQQPMAKIQPGQRWQAQSDWNNGETGVVTHYFVTDIDTTQIELLQHKFMVKQVTEKVTFADGSEAENLYWYDLTSGRLLKSRQTLAPFMPVFEFEHISNAGVLLGLVGRGSTI